MTAEHAYSQVTIPEEIVIGEMVHPSSEQDLATVLREASASGRAVLPYGGGTALSTGNRVGATFLGLDVRGLRGVREYQPTDLTASFWAGTPVSEVAAVLDEHGQELPLDLPQADQATIGGLVATGYAGPRRLGSGTLKDLLIGCGYVRGDGLVAKAGGMLVKNVSGFEVSRLLHGSWGSLAVLTSINLKVVPKPKADATLTQLYDDLTEALRRQVTVLQSHSTIGASVVEREADGWALHVRLFGRSASLRALLSDIRQALGADATEQQGDALWRDHAGRWVPDSGVVQVAIGVQPREVAAVASAVAAWPGLQAMTASTGTGSLRARFDAAAASVAELEGRLGEARKRSGATWIVESAPASWKGDASVWGPPTDGLGLMRAVKREFDPAGVLNRGRLFVEQR